MAGAGDKQATFSIKIEGNVESQASLDAKSLAELERKLIETVVSTKSYAQALGLIKGKSAEAIAGRKELTTKLAAERAEMSAASLALLKNGVSSQKLAQLVKGQANASDVAGERSKALADQIKGTAGPVGELAAKFEGLSSMFSSGAGAAGVFVGAAGALIAVVLAMTATVVGLGIAFAKWVLVSADAGRSAALDREAWLGSAEQANNLWTQIDKLGKAVPLSTQKLDDMSKGLLQARVYGDVFVDTLNASAQAAAALGDEVGNKLANIIKRSIAPNGAHRAVFISRQDLIDVRLTFDELAKGLAKATGKGIKAAQAELRRGVIPMGDAAKALRIATEEKFGELNARKMLSIDNLKASLGKSFDSLTKGVKLDPLLQSVKQLFHLLDDDTSSGQAVKKIVELLGNGLVSMLTAATPKVEDFFIGMVVGIQYTIGFLYRLKNTLKETFKDAPDIDWITVGEIAVYAFAAAVALLAVGIGAVGVAVLLVLSPIIVLGLAIYGLYALWKAIDWKGLGTNIVDGVVDGLSPTKFIEHMKELAKLGLDAFKSIFDMHSPSRVMAAQAMNIPAGAAVGVERGTPAFTTAVENMSLAGLDASTPLQPGAAAASSGTASSKDGGPRTVINLTINAEGATPASVAAVSDETFLAKLTRTLEGINLGEGVPIGEPVPT
jgi:hypothetical protein